MWLPSDILAVILADVDDTRTPRLVCKAWHVACHRRIYWMAKVFLLRKRKRMISYWIKGPDVYENYCQLASQYQTMVHSNEIYRLKQEKEVLRIRLETVERSWFSTLMPKEKMDLTEQMSIVDNRLFMQEANNKTKQWEIAYDKLVYLVSIGRIDKYRVVRARFVDETAERSFNHLVSVFVHSMVLSIDFRCVENLLHCEDMNTFDIIYKSSNRAVYQLVQVDGMRYLTYSGTLNVILYLPKELKEFIGRQYQLIKLLFEPNQIDDLYARLGSVKFI